MPNLGAFLSYILITTFTPGPNNILSMSNAAKYGFKRNISFSLGMFSGAIVIMALCSAFGATIFNILPSIKPIMTYIGAAYILWLSWKIYKSKPHVEEKDIRKENNFVSGFLLQFVNPKVIIYGITIFATFILPYYESPISIGLFAVGLAFIGFVSINCWALFGSGFNTFLKRHYRVVNTAMALLLVYCAVSLFH